MAPSLERLSISGAGPLYLVGPPTDRRDELERRLAGTPPFVAVEALTPGALPDALASGRAAGVVRLASPHPDAVDPEQSRPPEADGGRSMSLEGIAVAAAADVDCPVVAVGESVDAAAAYDAGATDVVPVSVESHAETVADRVAGILERHWGGRFAGELVDGANDGIVVHDPETGEILGCNRRFYAMLGYDPEHHTIDLGDITDHEEGFGRERAVELVREAAAGNPTTFEWKDPTNDGSEVWVEVKLEAAEVAGTEYVVASVREITDRKDRERELRVSRDTLQRLHGITADPDLSLDEQIRELLAFGAERLGVDIAFLSRIDEDAGAFEVVEAEGDHPLIRAGNESDLAETYCRRTLDPGADSPVAIEDAAAEMAEDPAYEKYGLGCYLGSKVFIDGDLHGTLCFADEDPRPGEFSPAERTLVEHMGEWIGRELEREDLRQETEAARDRLERTFERIDDAFFAVDTDWRITYANDPGAAVLRRAMDADDDGELLGRHLWAEIPDAVDTAFYDQYHRAMDEQEAVSFEEYYEPLDVWFEMRVYPDEEGLSVYFTDVTERKERERELERYETVLESLDDAVYAIQADGTIDYVNAKYAEMKGVAREDLIGTNIYDWVDDETAERADRIRESLEAGERDVGTLEYEFSTVDGEAFPAEMRFAPIDDGVEGAGRVGVIRDISERKERERDLYIKQRALEEASMPLVLSDPSKPDNPMVYVNDAFEELTGYDESEAVGRNCRFLQGPGTDPETVTELREGIAAEETVSTEIRNYRADGEPFWNHLEVTPIYDEDGTLIRYLGSQSDVTERRRGREVRRALLSTTRELMDADSREGIARTVSAAAESVLGHDLNVVYLREDDGDLAAAAHSDRILEEFDGPVAPAAGGPVLSALRSGDPVVVDDTADYAGLPAEHFGPVGSMIALPLGDHGVLAAGALEPGAFDDPTVDRGELLTVNAAAALDRMDRRDELERYETLFETVRDSLYVIDEDGYVEMVSDPLAEMVGYDPGELAGEHISTIATDDTVAEGEGLILDLLVTPDSVSNVYEGALVHRNGEEIPVEVELSLLPHEETFSGTVGAVRDISERRRRERELGVFRQAITEAGIGLAMYGPDGAFEYANDHYAETVGRSPGTVGDTHVWEVFEGVDRDAFDSYWDSFDEGETRTSDMEHRRPDGTTVPVEVVTTAVDIDGRRHHIVTVQEVTARRQRRQQTEVLHRIIRHNLRNDLTVVLGHAERLVDSLAGQERESAETILEMVDRLMEHTETVQEAEDVIGRDTVRKPVDVAGLLREEAAEAVGGSDATLETDLPDAEYVLADASLRDALRHVLENAVEHNDGPSPRVWVRLRDAPERPGWVRIEVADDGPGIPQHEREVLTAGGETALRHGSGVGLWIVHWVITRCGGSLAFEEREGGGSVVRIELPTAEARAGEGAATADAGDRDDAA